MNLRIDESRARYAALDDPTPPTRPESPRAMRGPGTALPRDPAADRATPEILAFYTSLAGVGPARDAVVGGRLDALRDAFSGPYRVDDEVVTARPMFRINGVGFNEKSMRAHAAELDAVARSVGVDGTLLRIGCAAPADLVKVTQALIHRGALPPGPGDLATRIRTMQWTWGIGVDCATYTRRALVAASGASGTALGLAPLGWEGFRGLDRNAHFAKVSIASVRPGDVVTLDPIPPNTVGHNVIVRSRTPMDEDAKTRFATRHGDGAARFLEGPGPYHAIEVDSSWGAGPDGADYGGFRRDTWIYDEGTRTWGFVDVHAEPTVFRTSTTGPASDDAFHGAYRAKVGT